MNKVFLIIFILFSYGLNAQNDTLFIFFEPNTSNSTYFGPVGKHIDDPEARDSYPFDGGGIYTFRKKMVLQKI